MSIALLLGEYRIDGLLNFPEVGVIIAVACLLIVAVLYKEPW